MIGQVVLEFTGPTGEVDKKVCNCSTLFMFAFKVERGVTETTPVCSGLKLGWFARDTPVMTLEQVGNVRESRGVRKMAVSTCS